MKRWVILAVLVALAGGAWGLKTWLERPDPKTMAVFPGLHGPSERTVVVDPPRARIAEFDRGGDHRLAILVTDPQSGWLGLVRGFHAHGVPITVTHDVDKALRHKVVLVYPIISGRVLNGGQLRAVAEHVRSGGTVVAFNLAGGGLGELFGVGEGRELDSRDRLRWTTPRGAPEEDEIVVSSRGEARVSSIGYAPGAATTQATFDDGSVAVACRQVVGQACVLGVDLGNLAQRAMNGRAEVLARQYANGYEPSLDSLFRWVRDIYVAGEPTPWLISTAPAGREVSIVFSHDVDYGPAIPNSLAYAAALKQRGIAGTFFVQTKYVKDYNDLAFFNPSTTPAVKQLVSEGMEVASHTVAHSRVFDTMNLGSGRERYPTYRPFVQTDFTVRGATILGELRVSKFMLEREAGAKVTAFRPGRLSYPFSLPQALQATGYRYSSSITADSVLTHLPFQLTDGRADGALVPIWEFPVSIEDEAPPSLDRRIDAADRLVGQIARDHGLAVVLIHPNVTAEKLAFEQNLADRWRGRAWMGSVTAFGDWWTGREALETDMVPQGSGWVLQASAGKPVRDVAVVLPKSVRGELRLNLAAGARASLPAS